MLKISTFCRCRSAKEGEFCSAFFALRNCLTFFMLLAASNICFGQGIAFPDPPTAEPPPLIPKEQDPALIRIQKNKEQQAIEVKANEEQKISVQEVKAEEKAKEEAKTPRPLYGFFELSLLQPKATVSSGRKNYVSDLTTHINMYVRTFWNSGAEATQPWIGIRIAPFGGFGTQGTRTARFAHTWLGPAIGFGSIQLPEDATVDFPTRHGFLFSIGVAGLQRLVAEDESAKPLPDDFSPTAWALDPPGVWSEIRWVRVSRGAIGLGLMGGVQTGSGKIFYYGGFTISGFL